MAKAVKHPDSISLKITEKQADFIRSTARETLYGGAAGGGKSYGQVIDAFLYALKYPKSKQIIFRKTFPELEKSILRTMFDVYPRGIYRYHATSHTFTFLNGSIIDCGYMQTENDVYTYQSAEYDVIRFDELTHFTEYMYTYMLSRLRGANGYPKYMKSSTNPTGVGRVWVKERFVDVGEWGKVHNVEVTRDNGTKARTNVIFIPAKVQDNKFLMESDPDYISRLENLPQGERAGLLYGEWDYFDGQYFDEFRREEHVCKPFKIPKEWRRYRAVDYGLDRLACLWIAVDSCRDVYVYKEFCDSNLTIGAAAEGIIGFTERDEDIYSTLAPPDLWNRSQESGKSKALIFYENGLQFTKTNNDREAGWLSVKELLRKGKDGHARLHIFENCTELIKCLPALLRDPKRPTDTLTDPHEITHAPDALRYFAVGWTSPGPALDNRKRVKYTPDMLEDYYNATSKEREDIIKQWGYPDI